MLRTAKSLHTPGSEEDEIKGLIKKTTIKINIIHPISKFNINCSGKLSDAELY